VKLVFSIAAAFVLGTALILPATADGPDGTVQAFVQPVLISISISPTSMDYEAVEFGVNDARPTPASFTLTNNGSVPVDLEIRGDDSHNASNGQAAWTLGGTPGNETYAHRFTMNSNAQTVAEFTPLTKTFEVFKQDFAVSGNQSVWLSLGMPTQSVNVARQILPVTVRALQATP